MKNLFSRFKKPDYVTVVSGLPRSGTSMMMRMLDAGGMTSVSDGEREADDDNPKGYYEFERVKQLPKGDYGWIEDARGKVVKIISALLVHLPSTYKYRVIFMRRAMPEILRSQRKMLVHRDEDPNALNDDQLVAMYERHLDDTRTWMESRGNVSVLYTSYNGMLEDSGPLVSEICGFLDHSLDSAAMLKVVEPRLYRQRAKS
jgi:hypothetical protein